MDSQGHIVSPDLNLTRYNGTDRYTGTLRGVPCLLTKILMSSGSFPI